MFGLITKKYHKTQIESLKKEFDLKYSARSYNMASVDRLTADWLTFVKDFNYDLKVGGKALLARARELYKNDPYAKKLVTEKRKGIIGPKGFVLRNNAGEFQIQNGNYKFVKDKIANGIINEQWWQYAKNNYITLEGDESLRAHCGTLIDSVMTDGEVFIIKLPGKYNSFGFTTQVITSEYCDWNLNRQLADGNNIVMGIEVNKEWKKVAYWFRKTDPWKSINSASNLGNEYYRVPAEKVIHLFVKELTHQLRGVTLFAPVGIRLKMLYGFEEASLTRSRASARVPGVITKLPNSIGPNGVPGVQVQQKNENGDWIVPLADGEFLAMKDGYTMTPFDSSYPHQMHGEFVKHILRSVSAGGDTGFSTLSNNYEAVTWHSGKLEKQSERDAYIEAQNWFIENYLNHIYGDYQCWLDMAATMGKFILPSGKALPVLEKFEKFNQPVFYGRTWEYTNPVEDRNANILALQSFQKTFEQVLAEQGNDLEEQLDSISAEQQMFKDKGLGELYNLLMTKYAVVPAESSDSKDKNTSASGGNNGGSASGGNGKMHAINVHQ